MRTRERKVVEVDVPSTAAVGGGGQIVVAGTIAFIGHMRAPAGTSIVDVADPAHPRLLAQLEMPPGAHSHKVRVEHGLMLINREDLMGEHRNSHGWNIVAWATSIIVILMTLVMLWGLMPGH